MTDLELQNCKSIANLLKRKSLFGLMILVTIPIFFFFYSHFDINLLLKSIFLISGILVVLGGLHMQFDANLFNDLFTKKKTIQDVDKKIESIFKRKMNNRTIEDRVLGSKTMIKRFQIFVLFHVFIFIVCTVLVIKDIMDVAC